MQFLRCCASCGHLGSWLRHVLLCRARLWRWFPSFFPSKKNVIKLGKFKFASSGKFASSDPKRRIQFASSDRKKTPQFASLTRKFGFVFLPFFCRFFEKNAPFVFLKKTKNASYGLFEGKFWVSGSFWSKKFPGACAALFFWKKKVHFKLVDSPWTTIDSWGSWTIVD